MTVFLTPDLPDELGYFSLRSFWNKLGGLENSHYHAIRTIAYHDVKHGLAMPRLMIHCRIPRISIRFPFLLVLWFKGMRLNAVFWLSHWAERLITLHRLRLLTTTYGVHSALVCKIYIFFEVAWVA